MTPRAAWQVQADGIVLRVKASPKASRAALKGIVHLPDGPALAVAVTSPPADGAANAALIALIAEQLGCPRSDVTLINGGSGRLKRLHIRGDAALIAARMEQLAG